jgi:hypothetical protein
VTATDPASGPPSAARGGRRETDTLWTGDTNEHERNDQLAAGRNIAMKVPPHLWDETVRFYRDVIDLPVVDNPSEQGPPSIGFEFGASYLWIDRVAGMSQAEIWLQLVTDDTAAAARHLEASGVVRCDDIEPLPPGSSAFWITSPASIVHVVSEPEPW